MRARRPRRAARERATRSTGAGSTSRRRSRRRASSSSRTCGRRRSRRRASARASGVSPFLFVVVGTGASACLVIDGRPYAGAHGEAIVLGAPPVERDRRAGRRSPAPPGSSARRTSSRTRRTRRSSTTRRRRSGRRARRARQRARPGARRPRRRARHGSRRSGSGSSGRCRALLAYPRDAAAPGRRLARSAPTAAWSARRSWRRTAAVRLRAVLDETGLWRDVTELPVDARGDARGRTGRGGRRAARRRTASGASSRAGTAPRTTSPCALWLASLEARAGPGGRGRAERPARARRVRVAAGRRPPRGLLVGRVPRPRRGGRRAARRRRTRP